MDDPGAYEKTNKEILNQADMLKKKFYPGEACIVWIVWDGIPKDNNDATVHFKKEAEKRNIKISNIITSDQ